MMTNLLTTKFHIPTIRPGMVSRSRLLKRLNAGLRCKLTLISAPAGFGKTTLLSEWVAQCEQPVAWLSLDKSDNDPVHFWSYVVAALQTVHTDLGEAALSMLQSSRPLPVESVLIVLLNQIVEVSESLTLVLDDYHVIDALAIHKGLTFLLEHAPAELNLVIATRADPPLPIARLRGRGQLAELYQADLRFTSGEAGAFLNQVMGFSLSAQDATALEKRTEGWIAGLQMAAISMRGCDDVAGFVRAFTGSHRYILDYLSEEVLRQQPRDVQRFLLQTAILDRLSGALCDAVIEANGLEQGQTILDSQSVLEHLERSNLFVVPLDDERRWYRYHHLFADLLRSRLMQAQPEVVSELHQRASAWYAENELIPEAVHHSIAAGDFQRAADLVEKNAWAMLTRGELARLLGWLDALPSALVRARPYLSFFNAWALAFTGELDDVERCLQGIDTQRIQGEVAAVRAHVAAVRGDTPRAIAFAQQATEHIPKDNLFLRGIVAQTLGLAYHWNGKPESAHQALTEAVMLSRTANQGTGADPTYLTVTTMAFLGRAQEMQGALHQAVETYQKILALASRLGRRPMPFACMAYVGLAGLFYEWNELDDAIHHAVEGNRLSEIGGFRPYQLASYVILTRVYLAQGDIHTARDTIQKAKLLAQKCAYAYVLAMVDEAETRLWIAQGDMAAVSRWSQGHTQQRSVDDLDAARELEQMALARVLVLQGQPGEALDLLMGLLEAAQASGRIESVIKILVLQALAFQAQHNLASALSALAQALEIAKLEGYVRTFLDEGEALAQLLRHALSQGIMPNYAARLLATFGEESAAHSPAMGSLVEPLSERELEVLRLIVAGMSNPEIAEDLFIAVSTVKSHTNSIYGKLEVENRVQAAERARKLGLV